ncbi:MAG: glycosyltransferase family 4 protein [Candidatus Delongbacteria bacterium]|nr:glycosyltransferase family 4 protein [Candidatus Delongbacteria bacterium]
MENTEKKLKILMVSNQGGYSHIQTHIYYIARILKKEEIDLTILSPSEGNWTEKMAGSGYHLELMDFNHLKFNKLLEFYRYFKSRQFDIIHFHNAPLKLILAAHFGCSSSRLFYSFHTGKSIHIKGLIDKLALRKLERVITISQSQQKLLYPYQPDYSKIETIPYGISERFYVGHMPYKKNKYRKIFHLPERGFTIGAIGRFEKKNGFDYLLQAVALLKDQTDIRCALIGDGPQKSDLHEMVKTLELRKKVNFTGYCEKIYDVIPALDLLIVPYISEEYSIIPLEAMAAGVPVIAFHQPYLSDLAEDFDSITLVNQKDCDELAQKIKLFYQNEKQLEELSLSAYLKAQNYHQEKMISRIKNLYGIE